jgi:hypothetical protein
MRGDQHFSSIIGEQCKVHSGQIAILQFTKFFYCSDFAVPNRCAIRL